MSGNRHNSGVLTGDFARPEILWLLVAALICAAPTFAAEPVTPIEACRSITDATARLQCFDRESAKVATPAAPPVTPSASSAAPAASPVAPSAPSASPAARAPTVAAAPASTAVPTTAADAQANFGLSSVAIEQKEVAAGKRAPDPTTLEAHIDHVAKSPSGLVVFNLDNGQVWRQIAVEGDLLAKAGDSVKISRGVFGSYYLQLASGRGCKVHRIS